MIPIETVAQNGRVQAALAHFSATVPPLVDQSFDVQQMPAPTFAEAKRAAYLEGRFGEVGLVDVQREGLNNVYGRFPGRDLPHKAPVIISAHSDKSVMPQTPFICHGHLGASKLQGE